MTTSNNGLSAATNGDAIPKIGPHPGFISSSNQYTSELKLRRMLKDNGCDPARQDNYRLQGVQLIENVREYLQLYVGLFYRIPSRIED
jgi:CTD kinase subunit beta